MTETVWPDLGKPEVENCPICGTSFTRALVRFDYKGRLFGYFPADVCRKGHDFLTDESDRAIEFLANKLGPFGKRPAQRNGSGPKKQVHGRPRPSRASPHSARS